MLARIIRFFKGGSRTPEEIARASANMEAISLSKTAALMIENRDRALVFADVLEKAAATTRADLDAMTKKFVPPA